MLNRHQVIEGLQTSALLPMLAIFLGVIVNLDLEVTTRLRVMIWDARILNDIASANDVIGDELKLRVITLMERLVAAKEYAVNISIWLSVASAVFAFLYAIAGKSSLKIKLTVLLLVTVLLLRTVMWETV